MPSVPDRSIGPNYDLAGNAVVNGSPSYPFRYSQSNGFVVLDPAVTYTPGVSPTEVVFRNIPNREVALMVCEARKVMVTNKGIYHFASGWATAATDSIAFGDNSGLIPQYNENETYIFYINVPDADNLAITAYRSCGDLFIDAADSLGVTSLFSGNPTFHLGALTDSQVANEAGIPGGFGVTLVEMRAENAGPTSLALYPSVTTVAAENGYWIGRFSAGHARSEALPCIFKFVAGAGDTDNASFSIKGGNLYKAGTLTNGVKSIRVKAIDRFGYDYATALSVFVGTQHGPTDIALDNSTVEADDAAIAVGTLTTTDADVGDSFTYTLVTGTGSTDNAKFSITGDALSMDTDYDTPGTYAIRVRSTDANGNYFEHQFSITVEDTTAPVMTAFTIPATGTSYDVTPASATATDIVGATHFKITEADVAPAFDAAGWVAAASFTSTAYTIVTQSGSGTYTLYCWAKDAADNVSTASISDSIDLTI